MVPLTYRPAAPTFQPRCSFVITALGFALIGLLLYGLAPFTQFVVLALGLLAVVFGLLGWSHARERATNRKMTVIVTASGILVTALGILVAALGIWGIVTVFGDVEKSGEDLQGIEHAATPSELSVKPGVVRFSAQASRVAAGATGR